MSAFQDLYSQLLSTKQKVDQTLHKLTLSAKHVQEKYAPRTEFNRWKQSETGRAWKRTQYHRQQQRCAACQATIPLKGSHIDHIKPLKQYPQLAIAPSNLQILCPNCNTQKGSRSR